jgi:hypothetical protein
MLFGGFSLMPPKLFTFKTRNQNPRPRLKDYEIVELTAPPPTASPFPWPHVIALCANGVVQPLFGLPLSQVPRHLFESCSVVFGRCAGIRSAVVWRAKRNQQCSRLNQRDNYTNCTDHLRDRTNHLPVHFPDFRQPKAKRQPPYD